MSTITREHAELKAFITGFLSDPMHDDKSYRSLTAEVFRIALASLEAEAVVYMWDSERKDIDAPGYYRPEHLVFAESSVKQWGGRIVPLYTAPPAPAGINAEPVAWDYEWASCITCEGPQDFKRVIEREAPPEWAVHEGQARKIIPLYAAPPAPVSVPDERPSLNNGIVGFDEGWNACRAAMLQGADGKPELTVWYGSMPETNGKTNWTAILHRKGQQLWEGITIDRSEYPDRVRYEADRMRHLIGELADEPDILAYDADAHSGYVKPGNSPVIPDDVRRMDWLVSKTVDVREPMVYGSHSLFWSQTITDEEDDYHATKLREQIDAAMAAENAAAPQQEAKL
ncbi:hypothetical protein [Enterobacter sp. NFIX58]|uniref:hypothetical protein n=1 Tax=Enterobacter sp. NFIX58 TaxID=1566251 RepID=UPI0008B21F55|nr:hypothetical protein SAMN03159286_0175 [Enterobacter sp. NFIX58]